MPLAREKRKRTQCVICGSLFFSLSHSLIIYCARRHSSIALLVHKPEAEPFHFMLICVYVPCLDLLSYNMNISERSDILCNYGQRLNQTLVNKIGTEDWFELLQKRHAPLCFGCFWQITPSWDKLIKIQITRSVGMVLITLISRTNGAVFESVTQDSEEEKT